MKTETKQMIDNALADGLITEKKREIILLSAMKKGEDIHEVELYLEGKILMAKRAAEERIKERKGSTCPFCGGPVSQLEDKCPHCNNFITPEANKELNEILENLEAALVNLKSGYNVDRNKAEVERYARKASVYYGNNPKIVKILAAIEKERERASRSANVRRVYNTFVTVLTYNVKVSFAVIVLIIASLIYLIKTWPTAKTDAGVLYEEVSDAIKENKLDKAVSLCNSFKGDKWEIKDSEKIIAKAYFDKKDYVEATKWGYNLGEIRSAYIEEGMYQKAESCLDRFDCISLPHDYFALYCQCIDHMKKQGGSQSSIRLYIDRVVERFHEGYSHDPEWQKPAVQKRLYKYAGIDN